MTTPLTIKADYYFAFGNSDFPHLWDIFTRKGFRHCCAFKWDGFNWLLVDPLGQGLDITILNYTSEDDVPSIFRQAGWTVIRAKTINDKFIFRGLMTCVTVCKQLVGIKACWVVTPWQLYNYIKKEKHMKVLPSYNLEWLVKKFTFGFGGSSSGPQSSADIAAGGFKPKGSRSNAATGGNPNILKKQGAYDSINATSAAVVNKQTANKNTIRRAKPRNRSLLNDSGLSDTLG